MSDAQRTPQRVALVNIDRVRSALEVAGVLLLVFAAFAVDWRLGVAVLGAGLLVGSWVVGRTGGVPVVDEGEPL